MRLSSFPRTRAALSSVFLLAILLTAPLGPGPIAQIIPQPAASASSSVSTADLEAALSTLTDPAEREKLVTQLRQVIDAQKAVQPATVARPFGARIFDDLSGRLSHLGAQIVAVGNYAIDLPATWAWIHNQFGDPGMREWWLEMVLKVAAAIAGGMIVEAIVKRLLQRPRLAVESRETERPIVRFFLLLVRTVLDTVPVIAFAAAAYAILSVVDLNGSARLAALAIVNANVLTRLILAVARMVLSPAVPSLRFVGLSDRAAATFYAQVRRLTAIGVYGYFLIRVLSILGIGPAAYLLLLKLLGVIVAVGVIAAILKSRTRVADKLRGRGVDDSGHRTLRSRLADLWHVVAIVYVVAICFVWVMQVDEGISYLFRATLLSVAVLVVARIAMTLADQALRRGFAISNGLQETYPNLQQQAERYVPLLGRVAKILIWVGTIAGLAWAWDVSVSDYVGRELLAAIVRIAIIVAIAVIVWELLRAGLARSLRQAAKKADAAQPSARARTLVPLVEKFSLIVLTIVVGLMVLSELGVDIGPLLAGAGIIGIAVGFGAQSLVKDVITGLFILIEDQFAVGDVVNLGGKGGLVEDISLRTIRLRAYDGTVFVIPFSEVGTTANLTKGFSYYVFDVGVAYREDVDEVIQVLRDLGDEMANDPTFGPLILPPLDVAGLDKFDDSAVIIKCRMKTLPIQQWKVGREFNRRMKKRFDELGIEIPFPHQTIYFGADKKGAAPPAHLTLDGGLPAVEPQSLGRAAGNGSAQPQPS